MPETPEPETPEPEIRTPDGPAVLTLRTASTDQPADAAGPGARSRRDVLALAGIGVVGGGLLAACGSGADTAGSPASATAGTSAPPSAAPTAVPTTAVPTSAAPTAVPTSAAPTAVPTTAAPTAAPTSAVPTVDGFSVAAADIPVGGGKVFKEQKLVITQPTRGSFKAFSAVCPHQGCLVGAIEDGEIQCPCHASRFAVADGAVLNGPAATGLPAERVVVAGTTVTIPS